MLKLENVATDTYESGDLLIVATYTEWRIY